MTTGERMRLRRKELGLSAEYVADKLKCSAATIYRYEKGDIEKMPVDILTPLSSILSTTPEYLMGWDNEKPLSVSAKGLSEIEVIFSQLSPSRQSKLLELARLYLDDQRKSGESK